MKKALCFSLVLLVILGCFTACNFTQNMSGVMAGKAEATPKAEEMMAALASGNMSDATALLHPQAAETAGNPLTQMHNYLAARNVSAMELRSINVSSSTGTSGTTRQEQVTYQVTLADGDVIYLSVVYLSNREGSGFASFQLVLGLV